MLQLHEVVFVGFNKRLAALEKRTGTLVWEWKASSGSGYVATHLAGDVLIACVNGHTFGLDPCSGEELWHNPMTGFGYGVSTLSSAYGSSSSAILGAAAEAQAAAAAAT